MVLRIKEKKRWKSALNKIIKAAVAYGFYSIGRNTVLAHAFEFESPVTHNKLALILITITMNDSITHGTMLRHKVGTTNKKTHPMINSDFNQCFNFNVEKSVLFFVCSIHTHTLSIEDNKLSTRSNVQKYCDLSVKHFLFICFWDFDCVFS